ncbi:MAG: NADH-quinone oxidoreductase subunit J [Verrucomicrobia bacterium]|nr:MAG: NADH-quinone oxidoreductase subunit J [Verrucomicrobiota bacterium]
MTPPFAVIAVLTIAAAVAAMTLRNLVHSALAIAVAFIGLAATYLQLNAQFVGLTQILVYVGAVAILIVFAILLTRGGEAPEKSVFSLSWIWGVLVTLAVFATLVWAIKHSFVVERETSVTAPEANVQQIGQALMTRFVLPLEVIGLLLTAALVGAVIIAMKEESVKAKIEDGRSKMDEPANPSSILHPPSSRGGQR